MGEIADALLNGAYCSWCGKYLGEGYGLPTLCDACWEKASARERKGFMKESSVRKKKKRAE